MGQIGSIPVCLTISAFNDSLFGAGWLQLILAATVKYCLNKRELINAFGGASKLVAQMLWAARHHPELGWLKIVRPGSPGVELLVDRVSADAAYDRYFGGEEPPLLPSQVRSKAKAALAKGKIEDAKNARARRRGNPKDAQQPGAVRGAGLRASYLQHLSAGRQTRHPPLSPKQKPC